MKKLLTLTLAVMLLFCMTGCGEDLPTKSAALDTAQSLLANEIQKQKDANQSMYEKCEPANTEYDILSVTENDEYEGEHGKMKCWEINYKITLNTPGKMCIRDRSYTPAQALRA